MVTPEILDLRSMGPDSAAFAGRVQMFEIDWHVRAIRVRTNARGLQETTAPGDDELFGCFGEFTGTDGPFETVRLPGLPGEYILWFEPYAQ